MAGSLFLQLERLVDFGQLRRRNLKKISWAYQALQMHPLVALDPTRLISSRDVTVLLTPPHVRYAGASVRLAWATRSVTSTLRRRKGLDAVVRAPKGEQQSKKELTALRTIRDSTPAKGICELCRGRGIPVLSMKTHWVTSAGDMDTTEQVGLMSKMGRHLQGRSPHQEVLRKISTAGFSPSLTRRHTTPSRSGSTLGQIIPATRIELHPRAHELAPARGSHTMSANFLSYRGGLSCLG